jgi:hypothetical protein
MNRSIAPLLVASLILALPPAAEASSSRASSSRASSSRACADFYLSMGLGPFPAEAETTPFFWGAEGVEPWFSVRWTGIACGKPYQVDADYSTTPGTAGPADHDLTQARTPKVCEVPSPPECSGGQDTVPFTIHQDSVVEAVVETFTIALSNPTPGSVLTPPTSVPFLIVDGNGPTRVAFDDLAYERTETYSTLTVPVWLGGSASGATVPYAVGGGATINEDYTVASPNPLVFNAGERVKAITLSIVNDTIAEPDETVELTLQAPTGATLATPSTKVVTIKDNEENVPPRSRFHHPRHKWKYKKSDYRIREFHVFAHDEGGSEVAAVELALRRNLKNGKCAWKVKKGWQKKDCQNRTWLPTKYSSAGDLFYYRMKQLKPSVKTKIKNYTAFSRAIDGAGNVEKDFIKKRNDNTFEIKRAKRRR